MIQKTMVGLEVINRSFEMYSTIMINIIIILIIIIG